MESLVRVSSSFRRMQVGSKVFSTVLLQQGMRQKNAMRVVTDGDDRLRNFVRRSSPRPMDSQLDWFHIGMKVELLRKVVVMPVTYQEYLDDPDAFEPLQRRVSRLRDALWRGRSWQALLAVCMVARRRVGAFAAAVVSSACRGTATFRAFGRGSPNPDCSIPIPTRAFAPPSRGRSRTRAICKYGSVRGATG